MPELDTVSETPEIKAKRACQFEPGLALYSVQQVREFDRLEIEERGTPALVLMQRAARASLAVLRQRWPSAQSILVFCGKGNNAGDGFLLAALAVEAGLTAKIVALANDDQLSPTAAAAFEHARQYPIDELSVEAAACESADVLVDALLGTGLKSAPRAPYAKAITLINEHASPVLALDIPSGLNGDTGAASANVVMADATASFVAHKRGLFTGKAAAVCGAISLHTLGIAADVYCGVPAAAKTLNLPELMCLRPARPANAHKGRFGHVLVIGGELGMGGAALLSAQAARISGAGLTTLATRPEHCTAALHRSPEIMAHGLSHRDDLVALLGAASAIVIGPGLGRGVWAQQLVHLVLEHCGNRPVVLDADALNVISDMGWQAKVRQCRHALLTPHPGEAARLLGSTTAAIEQDRFAAIQSLQSEYASTVLLKGAGSLIGGSDGAVFVCPYGSVAMASGGMGDVLAGLLGGLCAQGLSADQSMPLGVCMHSRAAELASSARGGPIGMAASELFPIISALMNESVASMTSVNKGGEGLNTNAV